jgi:hypothetical protein
MSTAKRKSGRSEAQYEVVDPRSNHRGKSYSEWATDWFNWFLSANADRHNSGPVVFLRSHGMPDTSSANFCHNGTTNNITDDLTTTKIDPYYQVRYGNDPNVRVGSDRLQIFEDQAIFVPVIIAYQFASVSPHADWGSLQNFTGSLIENGDNPPNSNQLTIDGNNIELPVEMDQFRISTPIFTALVPDAPYGTSLKDFLEEGSIPPGAYQAIVEGYFIMVKFNEPKNYVIHCWASSGLEVQGYYFSELLYEVEVMRRVRLPGVRDGMKGGTYPARNEGIINAILAKKKETGELTDDQAQYFKGFPEKIRSTMAGPIGHNGPIKLDRK